MVTKQSWYRADIDGLRAIAVLAVIMFHLDRFGFSGGFVGVDVFFVISGYLITSILMREFDEGRFSIVRFYERRARRIAPALFVVVAACLIAGYFILLPNDLISLGKSAVATILMVANIFWWFDVDYFSAPPDTKPLLHMWSLGVEEQFYLFWPFVLWLLTCKPFRRYCVGIIVALTLLSLIACVIMTKDNAATAFFWIPFRAWELLIGGLLIFLPKSDKFPAWLANVMSFLGLAVIIYAIVKLSKNSLFPGTNALMPALGTAAIIWGGSGRTSGVSRLLSWAPFVWVGLISYSLYLWHWPIIVFVRYWIAGDLSHAHIVFVLVLTFVLSVLSYRYVEQPFRSKNNMGRRTIFSATLAGAIALGGIGVFFIADNGLVKRVPPQAFIYASGREDRGRYEVSCHGELHTSQLTLDGPCHIGAKGVKPNFVLWGDSFAAAAANGLDEYLAQSGRSGILVNASLCLPILGVGSSWDQSSDSCRDVQHNILSVLDELKPDTVILHANWQMMEFLKKYRWMEIEKKKMPYDTFASAFAATIDELRKRNIHIVIITAVPSFPDDVPNILARQTWLGRTPQLYVSIETTRKHNRVAYRIFEAYRKAPDFTFLDPSNILCDGGRCRAELNGRSLYYDNWHLSAWGVEYIKPIFAPLLEDRKQANVSANH